MAKGLLTISPSFNAFGATNVNFKLAQCMRLLLMVLIFACSLITFFIFVRLYVLYLNAWVLATALVAILYVSSAAGRMVVEEKMLERMRSADSKDNETLQLPDQTRSRIWKQAFKMYAVFVPLVMILPILFYTTGMQRDVICQLASYASTTD